MINRGRDGQLSTECKATILPLSHHGWINDENPTFAESYDGEGSVVINCTTVKFGPGESVQKYYRGHMQVKASAHALQPKRKHMYI